MNENEEENFLFFLVQIHIFWLKIDFFDYSSNIYDKESILR